MNTVPIIRIEMQHVKHTLQMVLSEATAALDEDMRRAIDVALKPENISSLIDEQVMLHMRAAISDEIRNFFQYSGAGRKAIREAVHEYLEKEFGDLPPTKEGTA